MKPLYELVTAAQLKVGDVALHGPIDEPFEFLVSHVMSVPEGTRITVDETDETIEQNLTFLYGELVFRRIPATEDPRVLRRAL